MRPLDKKEIEAERLRFLEGAGAGSRPHSRRTLLEHLVGVRALLESWRARPALLDAGLFHSIYGTELAGGLVPGEERSGLRALIGDEAERIVHLWSRIRRRSLAANAGREDGFGADEVSGGALPLSHQDLCDLVALWAADTLEQVDRLGGRTRYQPEVYSLRGLAPKPARAALERVFADRPFAKSP